MNPHLRRCAVSLATLVLLLAAADRARAALPFADLKGYRIHSWTGGEGLRLTSVRAIVQDEDGFLWLAAATGLVRFDGVRFTMADLVEGVDLPAVPTREVYLARDGSLWVGYAKGHGIYRIRRGQLLGTYLANEVTGFINAITEDRDGTIWVGHDQGLHFIRQGQVERPTYTFGRSDLRVFDVLEDRAGTMWIATATGVYRRTRDSQVEQVTSVTGPVARIDLEEDPQGRLWMTDPVHGFRLVDGPPTRTITGRGMDLFFDRAANLWIATFGQGLWQVPGAARQPPGVQDARSIARATVDAGLLSDETSGFLEDRDGNLWIGANAGLHRLTPSKALAIGDVGVVRGIVTDRGGTTWLGGTAGLISIAIPTGGGPEHRTVIATQPLRTLHQTRDGVIWAAADTGLYRLRKGRLEPARLQGPRLAHVSSMASDRSGRVWACDDVEGVVSIVDGRVQRGSLSNSGAEAKPSLLTIDSRDRLWVAFTDGTLRMMQDGVVKRYAKAEGLHHSAIFAIYDTGSGAVWVGGDQGLSHFTDGRFATLHGRILPSEQVLQIAGDAGRNLWIGGVAGFVRVSVAEVTRAFADPAYQPRYAIYTPSDGTAGAPDPFNPRVASLDQGGRLWFVTSRGVTVFDAMLFTPVRDRETLRPRIEGANDGARWFRARSDMTFAAGVRALRIDYALIVLSSFDQVRFRYRLDGVDADWIDGTGRRQASYANLRPGAYRFRLQTTNTATWDDAETVWAFGIAPAFYETRWFLGACLCAAIAAMLGFWRIRVGQVRQQLAAVHNERARLSREIHDTLLQSLAGVAMQLDVVSNDVHASPRIRIAMVRMRRQLEDYMRETRESIWNLRAGTKDDSDLVAALRTVAERVTSGRVRLTLSVSGEPRPCAPIVQAEVIRIVQEAVTNAVRHARAEQVRLTLGFGDTTLRICVADDGRGFDPVVAGTGGLHYGLVGIRERAEQIGARCSLHSTPACGCEVVVELPLPRLTRRLVGWPA